MGKSKKISVIIPNYNYARYIEERIRSVVEQTYPIFELIILDDSSTDDSLNVINHFIRKNPSIKIKLEANSSNSGSVFKQWLKGISLATGDYIWIAEADDLSNPNFLEKVMLGFSQDEDVILSYCQSTKINEVGDIIEPDYLAQTNEIDEKKWKSPYIRRGEDEICDSLIMKCTIPNVSAAVFKNIDTSDIADELLNFRLAGDWRFYIWLLEHGKISYHHEALNYHRFHSNSVRESVNKKQDYEEFLRVQDVILSRFDVKSEVKRKVEVVQNAINKNILALENNSYDFYLSKLLKKIATFENVAIYGTGEAAKYLIKFLSKQDIYVSCVIEELKTELIGEDLVNVPIVSLEDAKSLYRVDVLAIASNYYQDEIFERIKYLNNENILVLKIID